MSLGRASALLLALAGAACSPTRAADRDLVVFASASLGDAFEELVETYERAHPERTVRLHTAGTPRLLVQVSEGAAADVFVAADRDSALRAAQLLGVGSSARPFATNALTIAVAEGNPAAVAGLRDLGRSDLTVVLCGPEVPAGRYARSLLAAAGVDVASASDEPSVRALVSKVALGEVDAAIVYASDVASDDPRVDAVPIADRPERGTECWLATRPEPAGDGFVALVDSPTGRAILERHGFGPPR